MTGPDRKVIFADIALLLIAVFWGSGFGVTHKLLGYMSPLWLVSLRFLFSTLIVVPIFWRRLLRLTKKDLILAIIGGQILAGCFIVQIIGLVLTTPGKQSFIQSTSVIMVPVMFALIYRRIPGLLSIAGAFLTTLGLLVMAFTPGMIFNMGDALSLLLAFLVALNVISVGNFSRRMDPLGYAVVSFLSATAVITLSALVFEPIPSFGGIGQPFWLTLTYLTVMVTVIPFLIQPMAQRYSPETHASILQSTECLWGYSIAVFIGQEILNWQVLTGGAIIFAGVLLAESEMFIKRKQKFNRQKKGS